MFRNQNQKSEKDRHQKTRCAPAGSPADSFVKMRGQNCIVVEKRKKKRRTKRDRFRLINICCVNTLSDQPKTAVMRDHTHVCFSLNQRWCQQHCAKRPNKNAKESALQLVALSQRWKADQHSQFFKQKKPQHTNNIRERQQSPQQQQ